MITIHGETYEDTDDYIAIQLSRTYGFKNRLAELINAFGMDASTGISDVILADYLYGQMISLSRTVTNITNERRQE